MRISQLKSVQQTRRAQETAVEAAVGISNSVDRTKSTLLAFTQRLSGKTVADLSALGVEEDVATLLVDQAAAARTILAAIDAEISSGAFYNGSLSLDGGI